MTATKVSRSGRGADGVGPAVGALLFVAAVVLPLFRQPGVAMWDTVWIEDGPIYVQHANLTNPFAIVFHGYAGYLQLVPRLLAVPTAWLPASWIAAYLAVASSFVCALGSAFVYRSTKGWIATWPFRLVVAAMVVLGPAVAVETTATITNSIWTLLAIAPWAFISVRDDRREVGLRCVAVIAVATSTALSVLFVPLAVGMAITRRTRASFAVLAAFLFGVAMQLVVVATSATEPRAANSVRVLVDFFGLRVLGSFLIGERPLDQLWTDVGEPVVIGCFLVTIALFSTLLPGAGRRNQRIALVMIGYSVVTLVVPAWGRGTSIIGFDVGRYSLNMTRYTLAPILALVSAVAILVDPVGPERSRRVADLGRKVFLIQTAMVLIIGFITPTLRGDGPSWSQESARVYATQCQGAQPDKVVRITTTPRNFSVALRCDRLGP